MIKTKEWTKQSKFSYGKDDDRMVKLRDSIIENTVFVGQESLNDALVENVHLLYLKLGRIGRYYVEIIPLSIVIAQTNRRYS